EELPPPHEEAHGGDEDRRAHVHAAADPEADDVDEPDDAEPEPRHEAHAGDAAEEPDRVESAGCSAASHDALARVGDAAPQPAERRVRERDAPPHRRALGWHSRNGRSTVLGNTEEEIMAELRNYVQGEGKDWNVKNSIAYGKGPVHEDFKGLQTDIN